MAFGRGRANSHGSVATHSSASGLPSPIAANVTEAPPSIFSGPPQFRSHSPTPGSPPTFFARRESNAPHSQNPSQVHVPSDRQFQDPHAARTVSLDGEEARSSSNRAVGQLQLSDMLGVRGRGSPLPTMQNLRRDSSKSSNSSPTSSGFSSSVTATPSSHTSLTSDQRVQRTLPPLSLLGLKVRDKEKLFPASKSPSTAQPVTFLQPSFSSSTSSGGSPGS